jgi:hypothetical protein
MFPFTLSLQPILSLNTGKVGIGTNSPITKLHVNGGVRIEEEFSMGGSGVFGIDRFGVVNGRFVVLANGNVGIGTDAPTAKLHIYGAGANATLNLFGDMTGSDFSSIIAMQSKGLGQCMIPYDGPSFVINRVGQTSDFVLKDGSVGIGTNNPTQKVHIQGDQPELLIENYNSSIGSGPAVRFGHFQDSSDVPQGRIRTALVDGAPGSRAASMLFEVTGNAIVTERMRINHLGNVGIGTTDPTAKLNVVFAQSVLPTLGVVTPDSLRFGTGTYGGMFGVMGTGDIWFQVQRFDAQATAYNLLLNPVGGNVGIGTANTTSKLSIVGLPTSASGLQAGDVWNNAGVLTIV